MKFTSLEIEGAWVAESAVWPDNRGFFLEWFKRDEIFNATGVDFSVQQANFSLSAQGVIRGIHYSLAPSGQAKWVTCVSGSIIDVVVDLRIDSPTFKMIEYIELEPGDGKAVLIGSGLGHGFFSKEDNSGVAYLLNSPYTPDLEYDICPTDPDLGIRWGGGSSEELILVTSAKDSFAPALKTRKEQGKLPHRNSFI
jgi:dTDP-4-dehydrorhamnose 3,5-epimerase